MTTQELKEALASGCPVKSNGITYKCVSAIITRFKDNQFIITAELTDIHNNSVTIAEPHRIEKVV